MNEANEGGNQITQTIYYKGNNPQAYNGMQRSASLRNRNREDQLTTKGKVTNIGDEQDFNLSQKTPNYQIYPSPDHGIDNQTDARKTELEIKSRQDDELTHQVYNAFRRQSSLPADSSPANVKS